MASSQSNMSYNPYQNLVPYQPDWNFITNAMAMKQQRIDTNRAQLQSLRNQLGAVSLAKDSDQEYLNQRIKQLEEFTNQFSNADISSNAVVSQLTANFGQVFDDNVKNAIVGTKILQKEQSEWEKMRTSKPALYSRANYEYAMRKANAWINDGQTGTTYNGGGGFIEFRDYNGKLMKALPDLMKAMTETEIKQIGPQNGDIIGTQYKVEGINKNKMEAAINSLLDEKDREQMKIDAWAKYDHLPEDVIREEYDNEIESNVSIYKDKEKSLKAMIANATGSDRERYQKELEFVKKQKSNYESMYYDDVVKNYGKEGVYTMFHERQVKDNFLEAFTFEDRVVDIEADEVAKANFDAKLDMAKFEETKRHNRETENAAMLKAQGKKGKGEGDPYGNPFLQEAGGKPQNYADYQKAQATTGSRVDIFAKDGVVKSIMKSGFTEDQAQAITTNKYFTAYIKKGDFTKPFMYGDKAIRLNHRAAEDYRDVYVTPSKVITESYTKIDKIGADVRSSLRQGIRTGDASWNEIPESKYAVRLIGDGKYKLVPAQQGNTRYAELIKREKDSKKPLNKAEKKELSILTNLHLLSDPTLSASDRNLIRRKLLHKDLADVKFDKNYKNLYKEIVTTSDQLQTLSGFRTSKWQFKDKYISDFTKGDIVSTYAKNEDATRLKVLDAIISSTYRNRYLNSLGTVERIFKDVFSMTRPYDTIPRSDEELQKLMSERNTLRKKVGVVGLDDLIKNQFKDINKSLEDYYVTPMASGKTHVISKDVNEDYYKDAKLVLGFQTDAPIKFETVINDDGEATGKLRFYQEKEVQNTKGGVTTYSMVRTNEKILTAKEAEESKLKIKPDYQKGERYDARSGRTARPINLGNGVKNSVTKLAPWPPVFEDNQKKLQNDLLKMGATNIAYVVDQEINRYKKGDYTIKLEPRDGMYYAFAYDTKSGKIALGGAGHPIGQKLTNEKVEDFINNSAFKTGELFLNILSSYSEYSLTQQYYGGQQ